jgi:hypothetical protein
VTIALAAVDLALWDLRAAGTGLVDTLGRRRDSVPVYGSGVNRHYTLKELVAQAERWASRGLTAAKIKVGLDDLAEDVERVAAVRATLGPDALLMVDANQLWDLPRAIRAAEAFRPYDPYWIEEPLPAADVAAYARLRESVDVPIALGENTYTTYEFRDLLAAGACDIVQPNVVRVGGITPFLRIADLARTYDIPTFPHLLPADAVDGGGRGRRLLRRPEPAHPPLPGDHRGRRPAPRRTRGPRNPVRPGHTRRDQGLEGLLDQRLAGAAAGSGGYGRQGQQEQARGQGGDRAGGAQP